MSSSRQSRREILLGFAAPSAAAPALSRSRKFDRTVDVIVVGSGGSGCSAAVMARSNGADTLVLEKAGTFGGTTSKSAGQCWIPNNKRFRELNLPDPKPDFLRYVARYSSPAWYTADHPTLGLPAEQYALMERFYDEVNVIFEGLERVGALNMGFFAFLPEDDKGAYDYAERLSENIRPSGRTYAPIDAQGDVSGGTEMIRQFHAWLSENDVPVLCRHSAVGLISSDSGEVIGLEVETPQGRQRFAARRGVVFASGGYLQDLAKRKAFQVDPIFGGCAVPTATGDFITIAGDAGAKLGNMGGAWRAQVVLEHALASGSVGTDFFYPFITSSFMVNKFGRRTGNERVNYHDRTKAMYTWDATAAEYPDLIQAHIYDNAGAVECAGIYPYPGVGDAKADYVVSAATLEELGAAIAERLSSLRHSTGGSMAALDFADQLRRTFDEFNEMARSGTDASFHRGETDAEKAYQRFLIDPFVAMSHPDKSQAEPSINPTMRPLSEDGPYHAILIAPGALDTNGGPAINPDAQVMDVDDLPIGGLFGAGNCIASPAGDAYWGAGVTLGLGLTFGAIAGRNAATSAVRDLV